VSVTVTVQPQPGEKFSGLNLAIEADRDQAQIDEQVIFTIRLVHAGGAPVRDAVLDYPILSYFNVVRTSTDKGQAAIDETANVVRVLLGGLQPGETVEVQVLVQVNESVTFSAQVPQQATLAYAVDGERHSLESNVLCLRLEGLAVWAKPAVRMTALIGSLLLGLLGIGCVGIGVWRRDDEGRGRGWIWTGVLLVILALLMLALVFVVLPTQLPPPAALASACP
jgi:hypothetical protein